MESYIQISKINDFLYCPLSLYLHAIYENFDTRGYHETAQVAGKIVHENIEKGTYSSARRFLQAMDVYSEKYNIVGKIDIYDKKEKCLIERKNKIENIYLGYKLQLYAQYFCMQEMDYEIKKLFLHSLSDNKRYTIALPSAAEKIVFEKVLADMRDFSPADVRDHSCARCKVHIYSPLGWR